MKKIFCLALTIIISLLLLESCVNSKDKRTELPEEEVPATNSELKVTGVYKGNLPCADCQGIETTLEIKENGDFHKMQIYQKGDESESSTFDNFGRWRFSKDSSYIELNYDANDLEILEYWQIIDSTEIRLMDKNAAPIRSDLNYSLKK